MQNEYTIRYRYVTSGKLSTEGTKQNLRNKPTILSPPSKRELHTRRIVDLPETACKTAFPAVSPQAGSKVKCHAYFVSFGKSTIMQAVTAKVFGKHQPLEGDKNQPVTPKSKQRRPGVVLGGL